MGTPVKPTPTRHSWERDLAAGPSAAVCRTCGKRRADLGEDAVGMMYEECPGKPIPHQWVQDSVKFMEPPHCKVCGVSQRDVHPHSYCAGPVPASAEEGQKAIGDGVALQSMAHPETGAPIAENTDISEAALETIEVEVDEHRLGPLCDALAELRPYLQIKYTANPATVKDGGLHQLVPAQVLVRLFEVADQVLGG